MLDLLQYVSLRRTALPTLTLSIISLVAACQDPTQKTEAPAAPTQTKADVIVAQTPASIPPASVGLKKVDFPIYLQAIPSLLHPIVPSVPIDGKGEYGNSKMRSDSSPVSYFQEVAPYSFQSSVYNLVFEDIKTGKTKRLFPNDNYVIKSAVYPFVELGKKTEKVIPPENNPDKPSTPEEKPNGINRKMLKHFIYEVKERPTDDDSKTNIDEQLSLYMSDETGNNLVKLHPNNQFVKSTSWIPQVERFYFTTQSDTNGDNLIDANDRYYNYVIDFANPANPAENDNKPLDNKNTATSIQKVNQPIQTPKVIAYTFLK